MSQAATSRALSTIVIAALCLALLPAAAFAETTEPVVPAGIVIGDTVLSGLTQTQARAAIEATVRAAAGRPVRVKSAGRYFTYYPAANLRIDVDGMLVNAMADHTAVTLPTPEGSATATYSVSASYTVNPTSVTNFLGAVRRSVYRAPVNAFPYVSYGRIRVRPHRYGRVLNVASSRVYLSRALAPSSAFATRTVVGFPITATRPKVLTSQVGKTILVDRSARTLKLFNGSRLLRSYRCAVGMPRYPTPLGKWKVVNKQRNPSWYNPGSAWAAGMPRVIGPGPSNPLGTRAMALNASGVLIHGTSKDFSIGTAASHGCIRMHRWDIEKLFELVPVGTRVWVVP